LTILYFDCFSGAAGDMILGALIDAGLPLDELRSALGSLAIEPGAVWTERVNRAGVSATKFNVRGEALLPDHAHDHEGAHSHAPGRHDHRQAHGDDLPHHRVHRSLKEIRVLIDGSALSSAGKDRAKHLFSRLGEAEALIHGSSMETVHLHEVGALDSMPIASCRRRSTSAAARFAQPTAFIRFPRPRPRGCWKAHRSMPGRRRQSW
jgi:uncharacterized protein (DUF111 family)